MFKNIHTQWAEFCFSVLLEGIFYFHVPKATAILRVRLCAHSTTMSDVLLMLSIETDSQGQILKMTSYFHKIWEKRKNDFPKMNRITFTFNGFDLKRTPEACKPACKSFEFNQDSIQVFLFRINFIKQTFYKYSYYDVIKVLRRP